MEETAKLIVSWAQRKRGKTVLACSMNDIIWSQKSLVVANSLKQANLLTADGMSLVWASKVLKGIKIQRVYGPDLMLNVCQQTAGKQVSHFFYGSTNLVLKKLISNLKKRFPKLKISGFYSPPFCPLSVRDKKMLIKKIDNNKSNIVWVGLGCPKQNLLSRWALKKFPSCVMVGVGAAFDFIAGTKKQAPKWMQNFGLEWLFRLVQEPRRLFKRYFLGIPKFLYLLIKEKFIKK